MFHSLSNYISYLKLKVLEIEIECEHMKKKVGGSRQQNELMLMNIYIYLRYV